MRVLFQFLLIFIPYTSFAQIHINTQNQQYPLVTHVDSLQIIGIRNSTATEEEKEQNIRAYLKPLCENNDAMSCYLLATTYDKFMLGKGTKLDADTAIAFYVKACKEKLADACYFCSQMYRYNFMNQPTDEKLSLHYLYEAKKYGSPSIQVKCLRDLAGIFYPNKENNNESDMKIVRANLDSTKHYLKEVLTLEADDMWTLDFLAGIYENEKNYPLAFFYYQKSANENSQLKIANWLATGRKVKKDTPQAIRIVKKVLNDLVKEYGYTPKTIYNYMGSYNPAMLLNLFYTCYKIISKNDVGQWYSNTVSCDDFTEIIND